MSRKFVFGGSYLSYLYLVDAYSPVEAFSMFKLNSTSTVCIRVRRSSDNTELDIGFANNFIDTSALLTFVGASNGFIIKWYNQGTGGATYDHSQGSAANQPRIVSSGVIDLSGGIASPLFISGASQFLECSVAVTTENSDVFVVGEKHTNVAVSAMFSMYGGATNKYRQIGNGVSATTIGVVVRNTTAFSAEVASSINTQYLMEGTYTAALRTLYVNGASAATNASASADFTTTKHLIGGLTDVNSTATKWIGHVSEVIRFATDQTTNRAAITANINSRHGIY